MQVLKDLSARLFEVHHLLVSGGGNWDKCHKKTYKECTIFGYTGVWSRILGGQKKKKKTAFSLVISKALSPPQYPETKYRFWWIKKIFFFC